MCSITQKRTELKGKYMTHSQLWTTDRTSVLIFPPNPGHIQWDLNYIIVRVRHESNMLQTYLSHVNSCILIDISVDYKSKRNKIHDSWFVMLTKATQSEAFVLPAVWLVSTERWGKGLETTAHCKNNFSDNLTACAGCTIKEIHLRWSKKSVVTVVILSNLYLHLKWE